MTTLADLADLPIWLAWQGEPSDKPGAQPRKVPYRAKGQDGRADPTNPAHWGTRAEATTRSEELPRPCGIGGVGVVLTEIGNDEALIGIDLDTCRDPHTGNVADWARSVIARLGSYTEVSPSETGFKIFCRVTAEHRAALLAQIQKGNDTAGAKWAGGGGEHPPAIELYLGRRYFTVTGQRLATAADELRLVDIADLYWLIREAGPALAARWAAANGHHEEARKGQQDFSRSGEAWQIALRMQRAGDGYDDFCATLRDDPETADWYVEKGLANNQHELRNTWKNAGNSVRPPVIKTGPSPPLELLQFDDMLSPNLTNKALVKGVIDAETIAVIFGESGCGKTFLTLDLALHIAEGRDWFAHRTTKRGRVVYVATEAGRSIRNRVAAWAQEKWSGDNAPDFAAIVTPVDLCHPKSNDGARLADTIGAADIVVIDTVSRALGGGDENSSVDMGSFFTMLDQLRHKLHCTIIAVHHVGKDPARGMRGSSVLPANVDTSIAVERRENMISVATVTKQRDGLAGELIAFRLRSVQLGLDQDGDPVTSCVVEASDYVPEAKPEVKLSDQVQKGLDMLVQVVTEQGEPLSTGLQGVKREIWHKAMKERGKFGEGARFRNAWLRVQDKLAAAEYIGIGKEEGQDEEYVWPLQQSGIF